MREEQVQQALRLEHVRTHHRLDGVDVLLAPHVLVRGEVRDDLERSARGEQFPEHVAPEINGIGDELVGDVVARAAAHVAHEFGERILVYIDHHERRNVEFENRLHVVAADRPRAADYEHAPSVDAPVQFCVVSAEILREERLRTLRHVRADERLDVEINHAGTSLFGKSLNHFSTRPLFGNSTTHAVRKNNFTSVQSP